MDIMIQVTVMEGLSPRRAQRATEAMVHDLVAESGGFVRSAVIMEPSRTAGSVGWSKWEPNERTRVSI